MSILPWWRQSAKTPWYCTHITSAISLHLLFALSLSAHCATPSTRSWDHQPGSISTAFWKSSRLKGLKSQMKLCNAARAAGRHAWRAMLISGGYGRILKHHFKTPNIHSITLCGDACWRLNNSFLLVGLEWPLAGIWNMMKQRHTEVGHGPTQWGGSIRNNEQVADGKSCIC